MSDMDKPVDGRLHSALFAFYTKLITATSIEEQTQAARNYAIYAAETAGRSSTMYLHYLPRILARQVRYAKLPVRLKFADMRKIVEAVHDEVEAARGWE
ncbi:hypothetical protein [Lysobacter niastensis]|uniref:Uncharacterized protein n=1 Tax=Lysobacter niastensis TaxID=380629 RepID=A0ABS0B747_9GAMM|nr:hypothetical protein [Lysobacter niastensis]MBF6024849.1 hypothetical protein [Lysobacter niastensis]